ncbi:MAG: FtsL-like putative cell division protein [Bacteroidia bacterium]|nr:FtsL-like putative cell division protein [Bacteroidia bacterium]
MRTPMKHLQALNPFRWLPHRTALLLYVVFWLILYVATQYRAEIKVRELHRLRKALSEKRAEYLQLNASVSQRRSYSALKPILDSLQLLLPTEAPYVISLPQDE